MARIYTPQAREFRNEDVMVEKDYGEPILQVASEYGLANQATSGGAIKSVNDCCMVFL